MRRIFISDLHLDSRLPDITGTFFRFLEEECSGCDELYILGDLLNYWIGDGQKTPYQAEVARHLSEVSARKFFMAGNRDFLLGSSYCRRCGMLQIKDPTVITAGANRVLLCHGDSLCTLDLSYQKFRRIRLNPVYRFLYFCLPMFIRQKIADHIRAGAARDKQSKPLQIMDIVESDFFTMMDEYNCRICIHGHTHKPGISSYENRGLTRYVLGDWNDSGFDYLEETDGCFRLIHRPLDSTGGCS